MQSECTRQNSSLERGSRFYHVLHPYVIALEAFFLGNEWATCTILSLRQQIVTTTGGATMIDMRHIVIGHRVKLRLHLGHHIVARKKGQRHTVARFFARRSHRKSA